MSLKLVDIFVFFDTLENITVFTEIATIFLHTEYLCKRSIVQIRQRSSLCSSIHVISFFTSTAWQSETKSAERRSICKPLSILFHSRPSNLQSNLTRHVAIFSTTSLSHPFPFATTFASGSVRQRTDRSLICAYTCRRSCFLIMSRTPIRRIRLLSTGAPYCENPPCTINYFTA